MSGLGPPPPPPGPAAGLAARNPLDAPLATILERNRPDWPIYERWRPAVRQLIDDHNLTVEHGLLMAVGEPTLRCLVTALAHADKEQMFHDMQGRLGSIGRFMGLSVEGQMALIDQVWNSCTNQMNYNVASADMYEQAGDTAANREPLPSTLRPNPSGPLPFRRGTEALPFRNLGVGFRVDGTFDQQGNCDSIDRITNAGMRAQVLNDAFMLNVKRMDVRGTTIALNTHAPRVWVTSQDIFNETAVCVSRSLFGATAFPERNTDNKEVCLWAVDVQGLIGFDTEQYQLNLPGNRNWRPGEKAYRAIPAGNVIGYARIKRYRGSDQGGWSFEVSPTARWQFINGTNDQRDYCRNELGAWAGKRWTVSGDWDFAT